MRLLLDTHSFLWTVSEPKRLPAAARRAIEDKTNQVFVSAIGLWEITIKNQIGKLTLNISLKELFDYIERNQIEVIPINIEHLLSLSTLPKHHGDPFDRLIISQAISEELTIITRDVGFKKYKVDQQWK